MSRVYVVVLNWNGAKDTLACVASLRRLTHKNHQIVVCDNDSCPNDLTQLKDGLRTAGLELRECFAAPHRDWQIISNESAAQVTLIHTGENHGYAGGMNYGIEFALHQGDASHVWILNNDTEVHPSALSAMLNRMAADPRIGICGATLVYHGRREVVQAWGGARYQPYRGRSAALGAFTDSTKVPDNPAPVEQEMAYVIGASMLVSRRFIEAVGLMDPSYFLYSEEHDWAHRGVQAGFRLGWAPSAIVYHKHGATIGTHAAGGSPLSLFYLYRNKALFAFRHHRQLLPLVLFWLILDNIKFIVKGHPKKAMAGLRGLLSFPRLGRY